jgi:anti-sigma factor RsiW
MNPRTTPDPRLLEAISAYLDGTLEGAERTALEQRLEQDEALRSQLSELRAVRDSLRALPVLKSPRPLTLSPAQAGVAVRRPAAFSPRPMAWGSALASLAFVAVVAVDTFSRGFLMGAAPGATAPLGLQAAEIESVDDAQPMASGGGTAAEATPPMAPLSPPDRGSATATGTEAPPAMGAGPAADRTPPPAAAADECGGQPYANKAVGRCEWTADSVSESEQPSFSLPDFHTAAPYLEGFFGASAVGLAVLAVVLRRRR